MFKGRIESFDAKEIYSTLLSTLNKVTNESVKSLDQKLQTASDEKKHQLFSEFETNKTKKGSKNPDILRQWTHYCWIKSELYYLASQRAILNKILHLQTEFKQVPAKVRLEIPAVTRSIYHAIQENARRQIPIQQSIEMLRQTTLQIVSTEHPTDPLSDVSRGLLTEIATHMVDEDSVLRLLKKLLKLDAIPPKKREVEEEISRNIIIALEKSYDSLPLLLETILSAFELFYGKESFLTHENEILLALRGGQQSNGETIKPIVQDASWPGFDADGNDNVTVETMRSAFKLMRQSIIKKYLQTIQEIIFKLAPLKLPTTDDLKKFELLLLPFLTSEVELENSDNDEKIIQAYENLVKQHDAILIKQPQIRRQLYFLNIQLNCFKLSFGLAHVRQDAGVHLEVWDTLFDSLKQSDEFKKIPWLSVFQTTSYRKLDAKQKIILHQHLQGDSAESKRVLRTILDQYQRQYYNSTNKNPRHLLIHRELQRYQLAVDHHYRVENIIISNAKGVENILEVESLLRIFSDKPWCIMIVPLIEERQDLHNTPIILSQLIKIKIQYRLVNVLRDDTDKKELKPGLQKIFKSEAHVEELVQKSDAKSFKLFRHQHPIINQCLNNVVIEMMFAYSDTARVSGIGVLITIKKAQEYFIRICRDYGVRPQLYFGPGGDINRGGLGRRDAKATLQGNARSNLLNHPVSSVRFRETQFYHAFIDQSFSLLNTIEISSQPSYIRNIIDEFEIYSTEFYESFHDSEAGLGKLLGFMLGQGPHWMTSHILNSSSRTTQRGVSEKLVDRVAAVQTSGARPSQFLHLDKLRAISATQMKEALRDNLHLLGPGYAFRKLGLVKSQRIYDRSDVVRDIFNKTLLALAKTKLSITAYALFGEQKLAIAAGLRPKSLKERTAWATECKTKYPEILKTMDIGKMLQSESGQQQLRLMLSRLFAYIEEEYNQSGHFMFEMITRIHIQKYKITSAPKKFDENRPTDLLYHHPSLQRYIMETNLQQGDALSILLARINRHVVMGENLDRVFSNLNSQSHVNSENKLTGVGQLLGSLGAALRAFEILSPHYYDNLEQDYSVSRLNDLRPGIARSEAILFYHRDIFHGKVAQAVERLEKTTTDKIQPTIRSKL